MGQKYSPIQDCYLCLNLTSNMTSYTDYLSDDNILKLTHTSLFQLCLRKTLKSNKTRSQAVAMIYYRPYCLTADMTLIKQRPR